MEVLLGVVIGIVSLLGILGSRLITTLIHETGHAVSALILTSGQVEMYVGSYGDERKSFKVRLGRLTVYLSFIFWDLEIGLCKSERSSSTLRSLIIILSGPLLSLVVGLTLIYFISLDQLNDGQKFFIAILMLSSIFDFFVNIIPRRTTTTLEDGTTVENDGRQLLNLFNEGSVFSEYQEVMSTFKSGEKDKALGMVNELIDLHPKQRIYHEAKLDILFKERADKEYLAAFDIYTSKHNPLIKYVGIWADVKIRLHHYDDVIKTLTKIIYDGKGTYDLHMKRGKALVELSEYKDAMRDFHALTLGEFEDPLALANRAYCQFRLGYVEEAVEDVLEAVENSKTDIGEIYFLAGVVLEGTDDEKALQFYKKALDLKYDHHAIPFNISRIEKFK